MILVAPQKEAARLPFFIREIKISNVLSIFVSKNILYNYCNTYKIGEDTSSRNTDLRSTHTVLTIFTQI